MACFRVGSYLRDCADDFHCFRQRLVNIRRCSCTFASELPLLQINHCLLDPNQFLISNQYWRLGRERWACSTTVAVRAAGSIFLFPLSSSHLADFSPQSSHNQLFEVISCPFFASNNAKAIEGFVVSEKWEFVPILSRRLGGAEKSRSESYRGVGKGPTTKCLSR